MAVVATLVELKAVTVLVELSAAGAELVAVVLVTETFSAPVFSDVSSKVLGTSTTAVAEVSSLDVVVTGAGAGVG